MRDRAILVARVSDTGQDEENQIPDMGAWSAGHDYVMAGPVVRIHGKSAFHGKHLEQLYREAVELVRADVADVIVMWAMDRGTRQGPDAAFRLRLDVKDAGGRLEFTEEPELNGDSLDAQEAWGKYSAEARRESEKRIRRVETGNHRAVANGAALRKPKYGWEITGPKRRKEWAVNAAKAAIAREMFTRAIDGETLGAIAIWASGADGGKWDASRVRKIIADPAYMGKARTTVSGEPYTYDCPPIVDAETWQRANAALKEPKRYVRVPVSPYAGVILCGSCGAARRRTSGGGSHQPGTCRYWRCPNGCGNVPYQELTERLHRVLSGINGELFEEVIVKADDMRQVRLTLLESELAAIGRKGLSPAGMIQRIGEISAEMEAIRAERAPRGRIRRKATGMSFGEAYRALGHDDPAAVNAWLKAHHVRVWSGGNAGEIAMRESGRLGAEGQAAYAENGIVVTWWLTED